jgi:hypothetical protein
MSRAGREEKVTRMRTSGLMLEVLLLFVPGLWAGDKHPERKPRDQYAQQFASEVEHDGWQLRAYAMSPGCGVVCINHGNHDCLRVVWNSGTVEAVDRFMAQEIQPRLQRLQELGFIEVDILGLEPSNTYPDGMARLPIK